LQARRVDVAHEVFVLAADGAVHWCGEGDHGG
jgi:hypothetical protein